ncbi:MAG: ABC transporter ATP-binding protein [Acidobacteria bacterium]|nr:ABC transporter ATP-binding protein [Acidobacteriota bacterium]
MRGEAVGITGRILVRDIKKGFAKDGGRLDVVGGISFAVDDGEIVGIVGPSGCGKSTLIRIIAGFDRPDEGQVLVDDLVQKGPSAKGIVISQQGSVFPWLTVRQNLMFGLNQGSEREKAELADHYTALVGLKGFEKSYPHELSGGMLKRVEIARALVVKPEILYMDEPFSALDALMNLRLRIELLRILEKERHTVVLITHDVEEALHLSDRILVLSPRPTRIQATFEVPFPHPRKLTSPEIQTLKSSILSELGI